MKGRHAICIVVDGLRASALGTYGNTIFSTPHLDALASRSLVADWLWADSPTLPGFYHGVWQGEHALRPENSSSQAAVLKALRQQGVRQCLISDDRQLMEQAMPLPFDQTWLIENDPRQAADEIENTAMAQLFSETVERLVTWQEEVSENNAGSLLWLHSRGMIGPWDAPQAMRAELLDEEDPEVAEFISPPDAICDIEDPDTILAHRVAYAAQVAVLDACLGAFCNAVEELFAGTETLVMLLGSRGFSLGEHGAIGTDCSALFSEQLHLPWLVNVCGNSVPVLRHSGLVQPADVGATLLEWLGVETATPHGDGIALSSAWNEKLKSSRSLAVTSGSDGELAIRTAAWMLRTTRQSQSQSPEDAAELYVKPDDRWEFNNVATRCPEVVEQLREELRRFKKCGGAGEPLSHAPLNADLTIPI